MSHEYATPGLHIRVTLFCSIASLVLAGGCGFFAYQMLTSPRNISDISNAFFVIGVGVVFLLGHSNRVSCLGTSGCKPWGVRVFLLGHSNRVSCGPGSRRLPGPQET